MAGIFRLKKSKCAQSQFTHIPPHLELFRNVVLWMYQLAATKHHILKLIVYLLPEIYCANVSVRCGPHWPRGLLFAFLRLKYHDIKVCE